MKGILKFLLLTLPGTAMASSSFMPPQATDISRQFDNLYAFLLWASLISCVILIGGMIYFVVKYRRKTETQKSAYISHNTTLEFLWSFIPLVLFLTMFVWGWYLYSEMRNMPVNALEVNVFARQWAWDFNYKSGKVSTNEVVVPVNTDVKFIMTSKDVIHSFYIPSMRIKQDVVPGRYAALWFNSEKLGDFQVFCSQYCGTAHSSMLAKLRVVSKEDYEAWLQENDEGLTMAQRGEKIYNSKGCIACHAIDGSVRVGPSFKNLYGSSQTLTDGSVHKVDEDYIRHCILDPNSQVVKGFPSGVMPSFQGQASEEELNALIEFIKGLK